MSTSVPRPAPGFRDGVSSLFSGFGLLAETPALWPWAAVPTLVFIALESSIVAAALLWVEPAVATRLPEAASELGKIASGVASYGVAFVTVVVGWFLALALSAPLSAPALEHIVERVEQELGAPPRPRLGFWRELACGFRSLLGALALAVPLYAVLWALNLFVPGLAVVTVPLHVSLTSLLVAWGLFDYPLTLRGIGFRARLALLRRHFPAALGFGLAFSFVFWFPCCGIALLPVGAAAATRLVLAMLP